MIDLSFLTEAEQEAILKVLNRDAELKKAEDERVKHLHDVVDDENEYKYKSGQWFYDAKSKRHREKINGVDLVRASIRKRKKPATIAELSELNKNSSKRRWVNSVNQDIFIPPELYGVMEAPDEVEEDVMLTKQEGNQSSNKVSFTSPGKEKDNLRNGTLSPPKPRQNPFNSEGLQVETDLSNEASRPNPENIKMNGTEKPTNKPKSGEEPLYSVVKKTPAASSSSQEQDFDLDDALMEPRFHGHRGKTQNISLNEKPLEFGKSFSGGGKMTFESKYPSKKYKESDSFSSEELTPLRASNTETSYSNVGDRPVAITQEEDDPVESVALWKRPVMFENQEPRQPSLDLSKEQKTSKHTLQDSPGVDVKTENVYGKTYPENRPSPKTASEEPSKESKYMSVLLQNRLDADPKPFGLTANLPVIQNMSDPSKSGELDKSYLPESKERQDLPKSTHFKVMSLKERINEMPREQMANPSQFQSLRHFWNVEDKNLRRGTEVASPDKFLTHVSSRNKPTRTDLKQRSLEIPADEIILPNTMDNLSEEEQTSQKVASWLAQTPTEYGVSQTDHNPFHSGDKIEERVRKSTIHKKSDEEFANALQKLREESLEVPEIAERLRSEEIQTMPQGKPDFVDRRQNTITISPISKNSMETKAPAMDLKMTDKGFYERVQRISNQKSPAKGTVNVEPKRETFKENISNMVAPEKSDGEFKIYFEKLNNGISNKEVQKEETNLPNKESEAEEVIEKSSVPKSSDQQDFIFALKKLELEASKPPLPQDVETEYEDELPKEEIKQNKVSPVKSSFKIGFAHDATEFEMPTNHSVDFQLQPSHAPNKESDTKDTIDLEETIERSTVPSRKDNEDLSIALRKLELEAIESPPDEDFVGMNQEVEFEKPESQLALQTNKAEYPDINYSNSSNDENSVDDPKQQPKVTSYGLKHLSQLGEPDAFEGQGKLPVVEEPPIERTKVESEESSADFHNRLLWLEEQSKIPEELEDQLDDTVKVPQCLNREVVIPKKVYSSIESIPTSSEKSSGSGMTNEVESPRSKPKDFTDPKSRDYSRDEELADYPYSPGPSGSYTGRLPVAEEPIEGIKVESQESSADFHNRLMRLEEQAKIPEEPEDLLVDDTVTLSQFPNRDLVVSKKVFSSVESMPGSVENSSESGVTKEDDSPRSKPKDFNDLKSRDYSRDEELANYPHSPEPSGSYTGNRNMLYKKPEVGSPEVSKSKPGMEESNPILNALKRSEAKMLNSKAVQEVSPTSTNQLNSSSPAEDTPAPIVNTFPQNADTLKRLSQSVPAFIQDETDGRDTDSASESSFQIGRHKKSPSSLTNLSGSSGMASMSSVSGSVMSIYSGDFGNVDIKGGIEFSVEYVEQLKEFLIYIYQCRDLAAAEVKKQRSDPYVKAYLLPEKAKMGKRKTAVKKKTLNPVYNEILRYKIPKQSLLAQTLNLSVWHHDALGRNSFLGEVNQNLGTWDWSNAQRRWYQLEPRTPAAGMGLENRGEMKLSLKYAPMSPSGPGTKPTTTGEVYIWIKDCLQLPMLRENKINSFVKCTVLPDTSRKSRQKTRTVDKTPNPIFNHTMVYDGFKEEDLREACVELTVWDHNRLSNHFLGGLRIGLGTGKSYGTAVDWMDSTHEETTMWEKMMASPNTWIEGMLPLRMFKMAKLAK